MVDTLFWKFRKGIDHMRTARNFGNTGYMHLIVRGVGRQALFEDAGDYQMYLKHLQSICAEECITLLCYCLMENHVHLLVFSSSGNVSRMMNRLGTSYAKYFNRKYERVGHLFQNRFLNENIYSDAQLLIVFRYILNNPQKAGICRADCYEWSSYRFYGDRSSFVDTSLFERLIGDRAAFAAFMGTANDDSCLDVDRTDSSDDWARSEMEQTLHIRGVDLQQMSRSDRNNALRALKQRGLSVRQIERLTGIGRNIVQRA